MSTRFWLGFGLVVLATSTVISCKQKPVLTDKVVLRGAGATFPNPLYQKWIEVYNQNNPKVHVEYDSVGSGEGINLFMGRSQKKKEVDFGASDAALSLEDMDKVEKEGRGVLLIPACAGSLVLAYQLEELNGDLKLPRDVYPDIFLGKITKWNDERIQKANPDLKLPNKQIAICVRQDSSGTTFAFTNHLAAISVLWKEKFGNKKTTEADYLGVTNLAWPGQHFLPAPGNEGVAGLIKRTPFSLGYVEYGIAKRAGLSLAWLENKEGKYIQANGTSGLASLIDAKLDQKNQFRDFSPDPSGKNSYPIVSNTWLLVYKKYANQEKEAELKKFLKWCLTEGQEFNESLGFIRLPPETAQAVLESLEGKKK